MSHVLTAGYASNSAALRSILALYGRKNMTIADITFGRGVFWKSIPPEDYRVVGSDLQTGTDFSALPYDAEQFDAVVFDPPYMHGGATVKASINACYKNENGSHASVIRMYARGLLEAERVVKRKGLVIVKSQDEIESGKQRWSHCELLAMMTAFGIPCVDLFIVTPGHQPAMRNQYQKSARKNHSYFLVGRKP